MGWAKYMEDDLEIIESRNANRYFEIYSMSYPSPVLKPTSKPEPLEQILDDLIAPFKDKIILCRDCGEKIPFPAEKQKAFSEKGWGPPKRCKRCKSKREIGYLLRAAC